MNASDRVTITPPGRAYLAEQRRCRPQDDICGAALLDETRVTDESREPRWWTDPGQLHCRACGCQVYGVGHASGCAYLAELDAWRQQRTQTTTTLCGWTGAILSGMADRQEDER